MARSKARFRLDDSGLRQFMTSPGVGKAMEDIGSELGDNVRSSARMPSYKRPVVLERTTVTEGGYTSAGAKMGTSSSGAHWEEWNHYKWAPRSTMQNAVERAGYKLTKSAKP